MPTFRGVARKFVYMRHGITKFSHLLHVVESHFVTISGDTEYNLVTVKYDDIFIYTIQLYTCRLQSKITNSPMSTRIKSINYMFLINFTFMSQCVYRRAKPQSLFSVIVERLQSFNRRIAEKITHKEQHQLEELALASAQCGYLGKNLNLHA